MTDSDKSEPPCGDGNLKEAEGLLKKAEAELEHAEDEVEQALDEIKQAAHCHHEFEVTVLDDGVKKKFEVKPEELVKKLLADAIAAFGPIPTPNHLLSLFTEGGTELNDNDTINQADVKPHELLLLRPSKVKGGDR